MWTWPQRRDQQCKSALLGGLESEMRANSKFSQIFTNLFVVFTNVFHVVTNVFHVVTNGFYAFTNGFYAFTNEKKTIYFLFIFLFVKQTV